jgi:hypothetical protein
MSKDMIRHDRPVSDDLHPLIYAALIALTALFVFAAWGFDLNENGGAAYLIAIVSGFFLMAVALPLISHHVWRKYRNDPEDKDRTQPLRTWCSGDLQTWQTRLKGSEAAIQIILPFVAAAIGMVAIAIVLHVVASGVQV